MQTSKEGKYEFLEHTADAKFRAFGKTNEEKFSNAALAMTSIMFDPEKIEPKVTKHIQVEGSDLKQLLYGFLEEFLILLDTDGFILNKVIKISIEQQSRFFLDAEVVGDEYSDKYERLGAAKSVTYNQMETTDDYVQVVIDI